MASKGYVVRGTHRRGWPVFAYDHSGAFGGPSETDIPLHVFPSLDTASGGRAHMVRCGCSDVAIFRVLDDGREERLPSYEEALGALSILRDEVQAAQDYKRGGMSCGGPPLLWTCPPSALKELLRLADGAPAVDPLAALEAAERRLLEAGGWTALGEMDRHGRDRWRSKDGLTECRQVALTIERRRLAAKGGA